MLSLLSYIVPIEGHVMFMFGIVLGIVVGSDLLTYRAPLVLPLDSCRKDPLCMLPAILLCIKSSLLCPNEKEGGEVC